MTFRDESNDDGNRECDVDRLPTTDLLDSLFDGLSLEPQDIEDLGASPMTRENLEIQQLQEMWVRMGLPLDCFDPVQTKEALRAMELQEPEPSTAATMPCSPLRTYPASPSLTDVIDGSQTVGELLSSGSKHPEKVLAAIENVRNDVAPRAELFDPKMPAGLAMVDEELKANPVPVVVQERRARAVKKQEGSGGEEADSDSRQKEGSGGKRRSTKKQRTAVSSKSKENAPDPATSTSSAPQKPKASMPEDITNPTNIGSNICFTFVV